MSNTLPSPDNMRRWQISGQHYCGLCGKDFVTLAHILAGCGWVRLEENNLHREDRYTWRHNCILQVLLIHIIPHIQVRNSKENNAIKHTHSNNTKKKFIRPGRKGKEIISVSGAGLLDKANDWKRDADLPELHTQ